MKELSDRERNIVSATMRLWKVNEESGFIPNHELTDQGFGLSCKEMEEIQGLVQEVRPRTSKPQREKSIHMMSHEEFMSALIKRLDEKEREEREEKKLKAILNGDSDTAAHEVDAVRLKNPGN